MYYELCILNIHCEKPVISLIIGDSLIATFFERLFEKALISRQADGIIWIAVIITAGNRIKQGVVATFIS